MWAMGQFNCWIVHNKTSATVYDVMLGSSGIKGEYVCIIVIKCIDYVNT